MRRPLCGMGAEKSHELRPRLGRSILVETAASLGRGPMIFAVMIALLTILIFVWVLRVSESRDPVEARLKQLGLDAEMARAERQRRRSAAKASRLQASPGLAIQLARADLPITTSEYILITLALMVVGLLIGALTRGLVVGLLVAVVVGLLSRSYLSMRAKKRRRAINDQLPDVLTLLVSGLRAGQGVNQALKLVVEQMPEPISKEFARVVTAIELGQRMPEALEDMVTRVGSDDLAMMVTAISIQRDTGGNLAETLEVIADTIRDRIRLQGEIRTLTAQQRLSGNILAVLPLGLAVVVYLLDPTFYEPFFEPGPFRLLPIIALGMQGVGYYLIQRIVSVDI